MKTVSVSKRLPVTADDAWNVVRTGADMHLWVPAITACRLEGEGVGAHRVCEMSGQRLEETIETVDDNTRLFQYRIHRQQVMPVRDVLGTIHLTAVGAGECEALWFVNFEIDDPAAFAPVKAGIEQIYSAGLEGLAKRARGTR
jgi:hypothetical protein